MQKHQMKVMWKEWCSIAKYFTDEMKSIRLNAFRVISGTQNVSLKAVPDTCSGQDDSKEGNNRCECNRHWHNKLL